MQLPLAGALVTQLEDATVVGGVIDTLVSQSIALAGVIKRDAVGLSHVTAQGLINEAKRSARRIQHVALHGRQHFTPDTDTLR